MTLFLTPIRVLGTVNGAALAVGRLAALIALGLMTLLILAQVYFRYIDGNALSWSEEAARFLMLWMTGLIAPSAFRSGGFVAIDTFNRLLPPRVAAVLSTALLVVCLTVLLIGMQFALKHVKTGWLWGSSSLKYSFGWMRDLPEFLQPSEDLMNARPKKLKLAWMYMSLPVGIALMISVSVELILRSVADMVGAGDRLPPLPTDRAQEQNDMLIWFLPIFLVLLLIGLPVFFALMFAPGLMLWLNGQERDLALMYRNFYNGMDSFPLMAIPFFMLAGEMMNRGGITQRLVAFAQAMMGHLRGGLAHVNILSSMLFAGLSGSAVADTSALGSMLIPAMEKNGYSRRFAAAVTAASSVIGPIIPPSGIMIIYAYVMGESVAALFLAGILPGILVGVGLMGVTALMAGRYDFPPASKRATWGESGQATLKAFFPLLTPVIILGGILGGVFTPTEASAIAAAYAMVVSIFILREMGWRDVPGVLMRAARSSAVVLMLVGAAMSFKTVVSLSHAPEQLAAFILTLSENPLILLFLINILLFIVGMFLDAGPAIIILGPILGPIFVNLGVDPIHFAIIMSVNLTVGLATPPMGLVLFVASSVSGERVETIAKAILPFLAVEVIVIFLITYIPAISMFLPRLFGFA